MGPGQLGRSVLTRGSAAAPGSGVTAPVGLNVSVMSGVSQCDPVDAAGLGQVPGWVSCRLFMSKSIPSRSQDAA